jgi:hypothetical protein
MRGLDHDESKEHLHRYVTEFAFRFNGRKLDDGEQTVKAIRGAEDTGLLRRVPPA